VAKPAEITQSDVVMENVRRWLRYRDWSVRQLAQRCEATGGWWLTESVLRNLIRGDDSIRPRRKVTVDDAMALAVALDRPLMDLMPAYKDLAGQGVTLDFADPAELEAFLSALKVTLRGLHRLDPFLAQVEEPHHG
jgi:hypothetical protein